VRPNSLPDKYFGRIPKTGPDFFIGRIKKGRSI